MENRPSKLQISVTSIKELDLTEGELKVVKKQSEVKNKSSRTNAATTKKSRDDVPMREHTSPEADIKRTSSMLVSKGASKPITATIHKSASSESNRKKISNSMVPAAKKRSSSVEQQIKTQAQVTDGKSKQTTAKQLSEVNNRSPKPSAEKISSRQSLQAVRKRSSSTEEQRPGKNNVALKASNSKPRIGEKRSGNVGAAKGTSKKSKSAGAASKQEHAHDISGRNPDTVSSAPPGRGQSRGSFGPASFSPPGMTTLSPSSHIVTQSKSKQTADRRPSHSADPSEPAERSRRPSATKHPSSGGRQRPESIFVSDPAPAAVTPFPFHDTPHRRADSVGGADPSWTEQAGETPTPWGGLGSEAVAALVATPSGMLPTPRCSTAATATKQRGTKEHKKRSLDRQKSSSAVDEQQCLSLSMARAVTDDHRRSFFTVLDDELLEQARERAEVLKAEEQKANVPEAGSQARLREENGNNGSAKRTASGRQVSSTTNNVAGRKESAKRNGNESVKGNESGGVISKQDSKDTQSKYITLENPFKKNKKGKNSGTEDNDMNNVYESALLDKWMAQGNDTKISANKTNKESDTKSKKPGLLKQLIGAKKPTSGKEKVLQTLNEKRINLLIPQSLPDPRVISHIDQVPAVGVSPIRTVLDSEAGHSQGADSRQIQEEFFTSADSYRSSIAQVRQRMARRPGPAPPSASGPAAASAATSTEPPEEPIAEGPSPVAAENDDAGDEEITLADAISEEPATRSDWVSDSSSEITIVGSDGKVSRRRKSALQRKRKSSAQMYNKWKRKKSTKAYIEYRRRTQPGFHVDDDQTSQSTSLSLYPATSSEAVTVDDKPSWSDISSVQTAPEPAVKPDGVTTKSVTRATSTDGRGRTEGTQTSSAEYLLLDRRSCLVKVLGALQRLNTDQALQVARILRRSLDEDRVYEDVSVKRMRSEIDVTKVPLARVESEKVVPKGSESRTAVLPDSLPDQDYDELTRIVSQIDLMVRSKLRITAAPYSLIYETLINYHLEITQDHAPSVAVFNYYLTEQGHPLFDDTSGFFRPTILQVPRESLYPRLYAHRPLEEPRELPAGGRLLDLQLLLDELLICPFCGQDVVWGQDAMCVDFCCDSFAEVITHEYEDDLGRIRRQAALCRRRAALGELEEDAELLAAALSAASSEQQPPAKLNCQVERRTRLRALQRYGQDGTTTDKAPQTLPFDFDLVKKASAAKTAAEAKEGKRKSRKKRRKSSGTTGEEAVGKKASAIRRRFGSETHRRSRTRRGSAVDDGAAGDEEGGQRGSRGRRKRSTRRDISQEVAKLEDRMGRRLTQDEVEAIMESESVMRSDARGLSVTAEGIAEKQDVTSLENIPDRGPLKKKSPRGSRDFLLDETIGIKLNSYMQDADGEIADTESTTPSRRRGKGRSGGASRRARRKTRAFRDREAEGSAIRLDGRDGSRIKRTERDSVSPDDQLHYRLSESTFLEEGLTQLPWDGAEGDAGGGLSEPQHHKLVTHPAESGHRQFLQERYPDGGLFVTWFDDGSGHVMYPSGEPAVLVTAEPAGRRFVVLPDQACGDPTSSSCCVLAMFDPRGFGFVYSDKGEPRLLLDQQEGWYHREDGTVRRWLWSDLDDHVHHSPTLQPVIFAVSRQVAIRVMRQDYIVLSFWSNQRSVRFNVGVTAEPGPVSGVGTGTGVSTGTSSERYRLVSPASDRQQLAELRDRVRRILGDMARITDEPVKYLIHHQKLLQRRPRVPIRRPVPRWLAAEPRQPLLPDGVPAALGRRSATGVSSSSRRALLLQRMALLSQAAGGPPADRRAHTEGDQPPPPPPPQSPTPLSALHLPPTEVV